MSRSSRRPRKTAEQLAALARADELIARRRVAAEVEATRQRVEREVEQVRRLAAKTLANRRAVEGARVVGPTIITSSDGSTVEARPYTPAEARRVIASGKRAPRAWNDPGTGRYAGGNDFAT